MIRSRADLARRVILFFLAGAVVSGHVFYLLESFLPLPIGRLASSILATCVVPGTLTAIALALDRRRERGAGLPSAPSATDGVPSIVRGPRRLDWLVVAALTFGLWAGGYFLVGMATAGRHMHTLRIGMDDAIPLAPEFVWCYLTIYPMFLIPFFMVADRKTAKTIMFSYITLLLVAYAVFLAFPVSYPRSPLPRDGSFSVFALSIVHGADPAWNCFPSTHCAMSLMAALVVLETWGLAGLWGLAVAFSIGVSTLFTKQHYIMDVLAGWGLTLAVYLSFFRGRLGPWLRPRAERSAGQSTSSSGR